MSGNVPLVNAYIMIYTVMATQNVMMKATNHLAVVSRTMQRCEKYLCFRIYTLTYIQ